MTGTAAEGGELESHAEGHRHASLSRRASALPSSPSVLLRSVELRRYKKGPVPFGPGLRRTWSEFYDSPKRPVTTALADPICLHWRVELMVGSVADDSTGCQLSGVSRHEQESHEPVCRHSELQLWP